MQEKQMTKKKLFSVLRSCGLILTGIIFGINVYLWNARTLAGNSLPMPFGIGAAVVLSGSMEPTLRVNDVIFFRETETFEEGDIVVFQDRGKHVVHRVIALQEDQMVTKGDANNAADEPVLLENVRGTVVFSIPAVGGVIRVLKTPVGTICLLALLVFLLEFPHYQERKKGQEDLEKIKEEIRKLRTEQEDRDESRKEETPE